MPRKPKPIEAGTIICRNDHDPDNQPIEAIAKFSIVMQKFYIDCPECGKIMPTLPNMQKHIRRNATFAPEFLQEYGQSLGLTESKPEPEPEPEKVPETKPEPKPKPEKNPVDEQMGF